MARGPIPLPTSSGKVARGAIMLAIAALQDERVRARLRRATGKLELERFDPTQRFGTKGIKRRISALRRNADAVFPDRTDPAAAALHRAIDELARATTISETMPRSERRRAQARITDELTRLEQALVDAVLPPER
jgi:hypothetical protein